MPDCHHDHTLIDPPPAAPWRASLQLDFAFDADAGATRLVRRAHRGPLRVQKALYPEGPRACQVIVVHPPGGVVGGDCLEIDMRIGAGAQVFATSPGAAKWYRANGRRSSQAVRLHAGEGAALEWMPQETIFYDGACVDLEHEVELGAGTPYIGSEILCFGRRAMGERFLHGQVRQRTRIRQAGRLVWHEQGLLDAAGLESPLGLQGKSVCATLLAVGKPLPAVLRARLRADDPCLALSQVKSVFVARYLSDDSETARAAMLRVWQAVRPHLLGREAAMPRIWNT